MRVKPQTGLRGIATLALGILVAVLIRWTPKTGRAILIYAALVGLAIAGAIILGNLENKGYWPEKPKDD